MSLVDAVSERLGAEVEALAGRVQPAAALADLIGRGKLPQSPRAAFVLPAGLTGGRADAITGAYVQALEETIAIVLTARAADDPTGSKALPTLDQLVWATIAAIAGWAPAATPPGRPAASFRLARGLLYPVGPGLLAYQLDFALPQQLRIFS